jgi:hypothetical protein
VHRSLDIEVIPQVSAKPGVPPCYTMSIQQEKKKKQSILKSHHAPPIKFPIQLAKELFL